MNSLFSSQAKRYLEEFCTDLMIVAGISLLLALLSRAHWTLNLFDQFWHYYFLIAIILNCVFIYLKQYKKIFFSTIFLVVSIAVILNSKSNYFAGGIKPQHKIYYQNISSSNNELNTLSKNIINSEVDLVALVETTPRADNFLQKNLIQFKNNYDHSSTDNYGFSVYSKNKINIDDTYEPNNIPVYIKFHLENEVLKIYLIHLPPPIWQDAAEIQKETLSHIAKEINQNAQAKYLLLGDFNMTTWSASYQDFIKKLSLNFYTEKLFFQGTWPTLIPSFLSLPIEHVISNRKFNLEFGEAAGSDHHTLIIQLEQ